jgi:Secretion system C-terminal sorting domain
MKKRVSLLSLVICCSIICSILSCKNNTSNTILPKPVEGEENEKLREQYFELRHRTAPNVSWRAIEAENAKQLLIDNQTRNTQGVFANGNINGTWFERGANNQAGSIRAVDYIPASNTIYTISNGGSLWSSVLGSGSWTLRNQAYKLGQRAIKAFTKNAGGERVLVTANLNVYYSDDNGQTLSPSTGINFPVAWGGNYIAGLYRLNDGSNTIYCLTRPWSSSPWGPAFWLYRSIDQGQTFNLIQQFTTGDDNRISVCNPYNSNALYIADIGSLASNIKMYSVTGASVSLINTFAIGGTNTKCTFKGTFVGAVYHLYAMINNNKIFYSTNLGASWVEQSTLAVSAWDKMNVSMNDPLKVSYGAVDAYRSNNGGVSFNTVNVWSEYYGNVSGKLHADIMEIEYFKKTDNTEFCLINCHGGTYVSYDNLVTVSNQSLTSHRAVELYDVLTDTLNTNIILTGTQDQGLQRTLAGNSVIPENYKQDISGDYGQLSFTNNNTILWPQYPGGVYYYFTNLNAVNASYLGQWTTPGSQKPNYGWMLAATATANPASNEVWIGGGNITGGPGSYLIKAAITTGPFNITATQFPYDFRANSNNAASGITAIEQSLANPNKIFVATEDGTFFYSNNAGANWNKTTSFSGPAPWYLYGSCILASKINDNLIWYSGSGYSNPGVYKSTDGGVTFTAMSNGLPSTIVNEIVASPNEQFIFAATDAGPYAYVVSENTWYSLSDNTVPVQNFTSVEYIRTQNVIRFATFGRGVWDLKLATVVPVTLSKWEAQKNNNTVICNWTTEQEINTADFTVERSTDAVHFTAIDTQPAAGNSSSKKDYSFTDKEPVNGTNFYRLKTTDINGQWKWSNIVAIKFDKGFTALSVYPNPAKDILFVETDNKVKEDVAIIITDVTGKTVWLQRKVLEGHLAFSINVSTLPKAIYTISIQKKSGNTSVQFIKQ